MYGTLQEEVFPLDNASQPAQFIEGIKHAPSIPIEVGEDTCIISDE